MNTLNLEDLAAGLENLATNKSWTYAVTLKTAAIQALQKALRVGENHPAVPCTAVGCALGHAPFIHGLDRFSIDDVVDSVFIQDFYGINRRQEHALFYTNTDGSPVMHGQQDLVSRGEVAARILFLIANPEATTDEILAAGAQES